MATWRSAWSALLLRFAATSLAAAAPVAPANASDSSLGNSSGNSSLSNSSPGGKPHGSSSVELAATSCLLWEGEGCGAIRDRETCLGKRDGRPWAQWDGFAVAGQPCAWCGGDQCTEGSDALCMPLAWVKGGVNVTVANCSESETAQSVSNALSAMWESPVAANRSTRFEPAAGGGRCAAEGKEESESFNKFYWTFTAVSHHQCQGICASKPYCKGFQYQGSLHECQAWWHDIDSVQEVPDSSAGNFSCVKVIAEDAEGSAGDLAVDNQSAVVSQNETFHDNGTTQLEENLSAESLQDQNYEGNATSPLVANLSADAPREQSNDSNTTYLKAENVSADALREQSNDSNATLQGVESLMAGALQEQSPDAMSEGGLTHQQKAAIGGAVGGVAGAALVGGLLGGLLPQALATHTTATLTTTTLLADLLARNASDDDNTSDFGAGDDASALLFNASVRVLHPESDAALQTGSGGWPAFVGAGGQPRWPSWALPILLGVAALGVALAFVCGFAHRSRRGVELADAGSDDDLEEQASSAEYDEGAQQPEPLRRSAEPLSWPAEPLSWPAFAACQPPSSVRPRQSHLATIMMVRPPPGRWPPRQAASDDRRGTRLASVSPTPNRPTPHSYVPLTASPPRPRAVSPQPRAIASPLRPSRTVVTPPPPMRPQGATVASPRTPVTRAATPLIWPLSPPQPPQGGVAVRSVEPMARTPHTPWQPPQYAQ